MAWKSLLGQLVEDYSCLAILGIFVGLISWVSDKGINLLDYTRLWLFHGVSDVTLQFFIWVSVAVVAMVFSAGFVIAVEPKAAGSGIPEMKTILRGVELKGYLTLRMLVAKVIGMITTLGSGMPLGKEGPFVHIGGIAAQLVNNVFQAFKVNYDKARNTDILAAGTAVGIAACFAAPVGGMLFSIEVTSTYFAVRHYWRRYLAALWGAIMFRLLAVWTTSDVTFKPLFGTTFPETIPYNPYELFAFASIGVVCGLLGALFVWLHRQYMKIIKHNPHVKKFFGLNRLIYPALGAFVIASITFPPGFGKYIASEVTTHHQMGDLFNNITWSSNELNVIEAEMVRHWVPEGTNVFWNLICYFLYNFVFSMIAYTFPVPCGAFVPSLKIGGAIGRLVGEVMYQVFPQGIVYDGIVSAIIPGGYALVGAAAFSAALTRSIAVVVIVLEVTGQLTHLIPTLLAVLVAYSVVSLLQPSLYDSIIVQKDLPYLPDLRTSAIGMYAIFVESFANKKVVFIWNGISYGEVKDILKENRSLQKFPLVDGHKNMILLGSVEREELLRVLDNQVGPRRRLEVAQRRKIEEEQRRMREDRDSFRSSNRLGKRRSSSVGVLPGSDSKEDSSRNVFSNRKGFRSLSRQGSSNSTDSRFLSTISNIFGRNGDDSRDLEIGEQILSTSDPDLRGLSSKRVKFIKTHIDFAPPERRAWELSQLKERLNFLDVLVNPAPVQLVEKTPLADVHSLFSMVGIYHAYVTNIGRLVGVVGLTELKTAIDDVNSGHIEKYFLEDDEPELAELETPLLERLEAIQFPGEELQDEGKAKEDEKKVENDGESQSTIFA